MKTHRVFEAISPSEVRCLVSHEVIPAEHGAEIGQLLWRQSGDESWVSLHDARGPAAALWRVVLAEGHRPRHPDAVLAEALAWRSEEPPRASPGLQDLSALPFVTVDGAGTKDLDQALYIERSAAGHKVYYAIADAAYYVSPGSALWAEALERGASYYVPGMSIPMLPAELSEGLVSLNPGVVRRAIVLVATLDDEAHCQRAEVQRALVQSRAKLSFAAVDALYGATGTHPLSGQPFADSLHCLAEVGQRLAARAEREDRLTFRRRELDVDLDGLALVARERVRGRAELYNEQLSLLCNVEVARLLMDHKAVDGQQPVFKVHRPPAPERLERLRRVIEALIGLRQLSPETWRWRLGQESLASYLRRLPSDAAHWRCTATIERQAMMAQSGSELSASPAEHYGVGASEYVRFTAPMREIAGVFTHKELLETLALVPGGDPAEDDALRQQVIERAKLAATRQRRLDKAVNALVLDHWFDHDRAVNARRPWRSGSLVAIKATKLYVLLDVAPIEVKVYMSLLPKDQPRPRISAHGASLFFGDREVVLGDTVELRVLSREPRGWAFELRLGEQRDTASP